MFKYLKRELKKVPQFLRALFKTDEKPRRKHEVYFGIKSKETYFCIVECQWQLDLHRVYANLEIEKRSNLQVVNGKVIDTHTGLEVSSVGEVLKAI